MNEQTYNFLTTIAENQPKVKQQGYNEGYEAGKEKEWSDFWDAFQNYGNRTYYGSAFTCGATAERNSGWTDKNFKPKYDIKPVGSASNMFYGCDFTDFKGICEKQGITFDTSGATHAQALFGECYLLTRLPILDLSSVNNASGLHTVLSYCSNLVSVDKFIVSDTGEQLFSNTFNACVNLKDIVFEGVIGQSISFSYSPLSVASLKSVITHLKDYAGTTSEYAYTATFKATAFAELEAEGATSPNGNTWAEYIDDIKWNLVKA